MYIYTYIYRHILLTSTYKLPLLFLVGKDTMHIHALIAKKGGAPAVAFSACALARRVLQIEDGVFGESSLVQKLLGNPTLIMKNTPIPWSQWNVEIPYKTMLSKGVFSIRGMGLIRLSDWLVTGE